MSRPRSSAIDQAIVRACVELLGESGREGLSRARIAARAGVSLPAVTRRYRDVDDILVAVASQPGSREIAADLPAATSLRTFLTRSLRAQARAFEDPLVRRGASELLAAAAGSAAVDEAFRATLADLRAEGLRWIAQAQDEGSIRRDIDPELLLDTVTGSVYYRLLWRGQPIKEDVVDQIVDQVLLGAASRRPRRSRGTAPQP